MKALLVVLLAAGICHSQENAEQPPVVTEQPEPPAAGQAVAEEKKPAEVPKASVGNEPARLPVYGHGNFTGRQNQMVGTITPDYILAAGDELFVEVRRIMTDTLKVAVSFRGVVNREGNLSIPEFSAPFSMRGRNLGEVRDLFIDFLERNGYMGIREEIMRNVATVEISLTKVREIRVFITGYVGNGGFHSLNGTSTVWDALSAAGGPSDNGSSRKVEVMRAETLVGTWDMYKFLEGQSRQNVYLQDGDMIRVPTGKHVALAGEVKRQAAYELVEGEGLRALLAYGDGLLPNADTERLTIKTFRDGKWVQKDIWDFTSMMAGSIPDVVLQDGDFVEVRGVERRLLNIISIEGGPVKKPGQYALPDGADVKKALEMAGGLWGDAYEGRGNIFRTNPDMTREVVRFNLSHVMDGTEVIPVIPRDSIHVYSKAQVSLEDFVSVVGKVKKPGKYPLTAGLTLQDLVFLAGGLEEDASRKAVIHRAAGEDTSVELSHAYEVNGIPGVLLRAHDIVAIDRDPGFRLQKIVAVSGEFERAVPYVIMEGDRLSDLLRECRVTRTALVKGGEFWRNGKRVTISFERALQKPGGADDPVLADKDSVKVPKDFTMVEVRGEVMSAGFFFFAGVKSLDDYVKEAGGKTESAGDVWVIYPDGSRKKAGRFSSPGIESGCTILVEKKPDKK